MALWSVPDILKKTLVPFITLVYTDSHRFMADNDPKQDAIKFLEVVAHTTRITGFEPNRKFMAKVRNIVMIITLYVFHCTCSDCQLCTCHHNCDISIMCFVLFIIILGVYTTRG